MPLFPNLSQLPPQAWIKRPSLPHGGVNSGTILTFAFPLVGPSDGQAIDFVLDVGGGIVLEWYNNGSVLPGSIPLVFTGTENEADLVAIIVLAAAALPIDWVYTPSAHRLDALLQQYPARNSFTNVTGSSFGNTFTGDLFMLSPAFDDGRGLVAIPAFTYAPRAVLLRTAALSPPPPRQPG